MDFYVFLNDFETFSPLYQSTLLTDDGKKQYNLNKLLSVVTQEQLDACELLEVDERSLDALEEDGD